MAIDTEKLVIDSKGNIKTVYYLDGVFDKVPVKAYIVKRDVGALNNYRYMQVMDDNGRILTLETDYAIDLDSVEELAKI